MAMVPVPFGPSEAQRRAVGVLSPLHSARTQLEVERRWVLEGQPALGHPVLRTLEAVRITQTYLAKPAGGEPRARVRRIVAADGAVRHVWTAKRRLSSLVRVEREVEIDAATYDELRRRADPRRAVVEKVRRPFTYAGVRFELDHLVSPVECWLLEVELDELRQAVVIPPFVGGVREVTDQPGFTNASLARRHLAAC